MTLVAPLNWGLGHATRCVPIINRCLENGEQVLLAADGNALEFLKNEFPQLTTIKLKGYNIRYAGERLLPFVIMLQLPLFVFSIVIEHFRLKKIVKLYSINKIISDNRYGLWCKKVNSIIVTHQLYIQLPKWLKWLSKPLHSITAFMLLKFNDIWVPDFANFDTSLSGKLAHGGKLDDKVVYIGPLSRFKKHSVPMCSKSADILLLLSGLGKQKTKLANSVKNSIKNSKQKLLILGAEPKQKYEITSNNILEINHLSSAELNSLLLSVPQIISRSGYSTIMDLYCLGRTAKLIPTKGQWEQEYLQQWLEKRGGIISYD